MKITDYRIHQRPPGLEIAFDSGEVFHIPAHIQSLAINQNQTSFTIIQNNKTNTYTSTEIYQLAKNKKSL